MAGSARMHVLQAVRQLYEVVDGKAWGVTEQRMSRVVVIGRRLDKAKLLSSLREACCLAAHAHARGRAGPRDAHTSLFGSFSTSRRDETDIEAFLGGRGGLKRQHNPDTPRLASKRGGMGSRRSSSPGPD